MTISALGAPSRWVLRRAGRTPALRLFCFCYAGGNAAIYLPWQAALGPDVEVCAIQLPGRGARFSEALLQDVDSTLPSIAAAINPLLDRPFAFFGHSLGALLAYETCHHLRACGAPLPRQLILSGAHGPRARAEKKPLHLLDDADLTLELERYAGTPPQVLASPELLALVLPIVRADFQMAIEYRYRARPPLPIPLTVFAGRDDEFDSVGQYEDWFAESNTRTALHWFDGGHFFINSAAEKVLAQLRSILAPELQGNPMFRQA